MLGARCRSPPRADDDLHLSDGLPVGQVSIQSRAPSARAAFNHSRGTTAIAGQEPASPWAYGAFNRSSLSLDSMNPRSKRWPGVLLARRGAEALTAIFQTWRRRIAGRSPTRVADKVTRI